MSIIISSPLYRFWAIAMTLAISSVDSTIQRKFIHLLSAVRTIRKRSLNLGNETPSRFVLEDIDEMIGDWWSWEYHIRSILHLLLDPYANFTVFLALRSDSQDLKKPERHVHWIRLNGFAARLTKASICDWRPMPQFSVTSFLRIHNSARILYGLPSRCPLPPNS